MHGCFLINEGELPINVILEIHDMIEQNKMGKVDWIPDKYQIEGTVTLGAEDQDFTLGVKCRIFKHPELEERYICDIQKDVTKGEMEENLDVALLV